MKRVSLFWAIIGFLVIGSLALPHIACADCSNANIHCNYRGGGMTVATTTFSMCWSWKYFECRPCHGGAQWGYFAQWCNSNYKGCMNECYGCYVNQNLCYDKQGNAYLINN